MGFSYDCLLRDHLLIWNQFHDCVFSESVSSVAQVIQVSPHIVWTVSVNPQRVVSVFSWTEAGEMNVVQHQQEIIVIVDR